jgi:phosphoribosyl 1,2-cyclic phosphate phosphodiesterase
MMTMRIQFLGTSAANAFPEAFCICENCVKARAAGGKSLRKRSSLLVNEDLLIDLGPDIMAASQVHNIALTGVKYCLQTHPHADHLDLSHLLSRSPGFGVVGAPRLHFYASAALLERADQTFQRDLWGYGLLDPRAEEELNLAVHTLEPFQPLMVGPYRVIAFPANHGQRGEAFLYAVESGERSLFYGTDTAALLEETWQGFLRHKMHFDIVVFDHTYGPKEPGGDHLSARQVIDHMQRMRLEGILKDSGRVFATHIAHEGNPIYPELVDFASQHGYEVAYDGLTISL